MSNIKRKKTKKIRLKESFKRALVYSFVLLLFVIYGVKEGTKVYETLQYQKTYEYKIIEIGFPEEEAKVIASTLSDEELEAILAKEKYNPQYYKLITEKYFLTKNYNEYLKYLEDNKTEDYTKVIALVNTHASKPWYTDTEKTDIDQGYLILVNKYHYLEETYERIDLVPFSLNYSYGAYGDNKAAEIVVDSFDKMQKDVKEQFGAQLMVNSSYRDYENQEKTHKTYGDKTAARPGYSEHQTGLGIDITSIKNSKGTTFGESEEGKWVKDNCWRYGFILRYPEGKEDITGYDNEPWHLRYVGEKVAKQIYDENITFDEYYAYYIEK